MISKARNIKPRNRSHVGVQKQTNSSADKHMTKYKGVLLFRVEGFFSFSGMLAQLMSIWKDHNCLARTFWAIPPVLIQNSGIKVLWLQPVTNRISRWFVNLLVCFEWPCVLIQIVVCPPHERCDFQTEWHVSRLYWRS